LSALRVEDVIYFSQHEDFPAMVSKQSRGRPQDWLAKAGRVFVCATLRKESAGDGKQYHDIFKLYSHSCAVRRCAHEVHVRLREAIAEAVGSPDPGHHDPHQEDHPAPKLTL